MRENQVSRSTSALPTGSTITAMELNAVVVRRKGFPVKMAKVEPVLNSNPQRWQQVSDEETGDLETDTVWVRFDVNSIADVEATFGSINSYLSALSVRTHSTLRRALAIVTERDEREIGVAMLPEEGNDYLLAAQMAWSVAMGMDPAQAAKLMELGRVENRKRGAAEAARIAAELDAEAARISADLEATEVVTKPDETKD